MQLRLLVITDHSTHSPENSLYQLVREMMRHPACGQVDVVSRGNPENRLFFENMMVKSLYGCRVHNNFEYFPDGRCFKKRLEKLALRSYDAVLMRLPHPTPPGFWQFLAEVFPGALLVNNPKGLEVTGSKAFLLNFQDMCPPMQRCDTLEAIETFRQQFPIVLKPLHGHSGLGIFKIQGEKVWKAEGGDLTYSAFVRQLQKTKFDFIGAKYLENVVKGDKRIAVCNGHTLGAALRMPASGGWVCNVARGGKSMKTEIDENETAILERLTPELARHGVIFYGIDTLMDDTGQRVLSEINTLSIGGLPKIAEFTGKPVLRQTADLLWEYIESKL